MSNCRRAIILFWLKNIIYIFIYSPWMNIVWGCKNSGGVKNTNIEQVNLWDRAQFSGVKMPSASFLVDYFFQLKFGLNDVPILCVPPDHQSQINIWRTEKSFISLGRLSFHLVAEKKSFYLIRIIRSFPKVCFIFQVCHVLQYNSLNIMWLEVHLPVKC